MKTFESTRIINRTSNSGLFAGENQNYEKRLNELTTDINVQKEELKKQKDDFYKDLDEAKHKITDTSNLMVMGFMILLIMVFTVVVMLLTDFTKSYREIYKDAISGQVR